MEPRRPPGLWARNRRNVAELVCAAVDALQRGQEFPLPPVDVVFRRDGKQRLMAGTDWPLVEGYCGYAKAVAIVRDQMQFLNDDDKSWMMSKTIERVWPFG